MNIHEYTRINKNYVANFVPVENNFLKFIRKYSQYLVTYKIFLRGKFRGVGLPNKIISKIPLDGKVTDEFRKMIEIKLNIT